ncbi:polyketide synthase, partial [Cryomyces antarcticus]
MSNIVLFGDQTADQYSLLRKISLRRDNALLTTFLERVAVALREEIRKLPRSQREAIPDFLTVQHLVEAYYEKGVRIAPVESCLVTIAQLSHYIGFYSENPSEVPAPFNTRVIGLCTGLLAGAAIASAKTLNDLIPIAVEMVRISFRTGSTVGTAKDALEQNTTDRLSWSTIVTGTSEQAAKEALAAFHQEKGIPVSSQAYVSAVSVMAVTISGPPSTTQRLFQDSEALRKNHR